MKEASTQITINLENIAVQYEQCAMVDANVGTDIISRKNKSTNTNDTSINCDTKMGEIHAVKSKQSYCNEIKRSLSENGYRKLSTSTQTENPHRLENSHVSI